MTSSLATGASRQHRQHHPRRLRTHRRPRAGRLLPRRAERPPRHHRDPLHRPRPRARRHPLPPLRHRGRRPRRRARALPRDDLQGRRGRARPRRWQGRHHRRPAHAQVRGAAARLRPLRGEPARPLLHRLRRRHVQPRHGRHRPGVALRDRAHHRERRRRRLLGAHRLRRLPGDACRRRRSPGASRPCRAARVGVSGVGKVGRHLVRHLVEDGADVVVTDVLAPAVAAVEQEHPSVRAVPTTEELVRLPLDVYAPCALGGALDDHVVDGAPRQGRLRRRQQPARPPRHREGAAGQGRPLRARLPRQRRRPDPGRRRAGRVLLRARPARAPSRSTTRRWRCSGSPTRTAYRPRWRPTGSPSGGSPRSAGCAGSGSADGPGGPTRVVPPSAQRLSVPV